MVTADAARDCRDSGLVTVVTVVVVVDAGRSAAGTLTPEDGGKHCTAVEAVCWDW